MQNCLLQRGRRLRGHRFSPRREIETLSLIDFGKTANDLSPREPLEIPPNDFPSPPLLTSSRRRPIPLLSIGYNGVAIKDSFVRQLNWARRRLNPRIIRSGVDSSCARLFARPSKKADFPTYVSGVMGFFVSSLKGLSCLVFVSWQVQYPLHFFFVSPREVYTGVRPPPSVCVHEREHNQVASIK